MSMEIESLLDSNRILCHVSCSSKKRSLEMLAELIAGQSSEIDAGDLFEHLIARERLGSTGIGSGIAIPHCRFKTAGVTIGALMTLDRPIEFDSVDGRPVDIIFAMLVPDNAEAEHLQTLAKLVEQLQKPAYVAALREASDGEELYKAAIHSDEGG